MLEILRFTTGQQDEDDGAEPALANGAPSSFAQVQVACLNASQSRFGPADTFFDPDMAWASIGLSFVAVTNKQFAQNNISSAEVRHNNRLEVDVLSEIVVVVGEVLLSSLTASSLWCINNLNAPLCLFGNVW